MIKLVTHEKYKRRAFVNEIHGFFPYKCYMEIINATNIGKYIVIVGQKAVDIRNNEKVNIEITLMNKDKIETTASYTARRINPMNIKEEKILVLKEIN